MSAYFGVFLIMAGLLSVFVYTLIVHSICSSVGCHGAMRATFSVIAYGSWPMCIPLITAVVSKNIFPNTAILSVLSLAWMVVVNHAGMRVLHGLSSGLSWIMSIAGAFAAFLSYITGTLVMFMVMMANYSW
jgi:hypothetical protein